LHLDGGNTAASTTPTPMAIKYMRSSTAAAAYTGDVDGGDFLIIIDASVSL
jgi:hypothetical protein